MLRWLFRFYFVSDPTLLELLSLGSNPQAVVPHFQSGLFDSLSDVAFDSVSASRILTMFSVQGEEVRLQTPFEAVGGLTDSNLFRLRVVTRVHCPDCMRRQC